MRVNAAGRKLIEDAEGFRPRAYRCPAGVWTIGFGHTRAAGLPEVKAGMVISRAQAQAILAEDLDGFARGVARAITTEINDNQFSALVAFAFNVGLGAFRSSSVVRAVNGRQFDLVPRRLGLYVKARGRTLPGLVKRRHAEGLLFLTPAGAGFLSFNLPRFSKAEREDMDKARGLIDAPRGTPLRWSSTVWATVASGVTGIFGAVQSALWQLHDFTSIFTIPPRTYAAMTFIAVIGAATFWIIAERRRHAEDDDV